LLAQELKRLKNLPDGALKGSGNLGHCEVLFELSGRQLFALAECGASLPPGFIIKEKGENYAALRDDINDVAGEPALLCAGSSVGR
jgi:hypothetical protein